ncbi:MAG: alpha-xylosidase [Sphaerochaetaceae bacterium]
MKFINGYWLLRENVTAKFALEAIEAEQNDTALTVYGACRMIQSRADCNDLTMLTVQVTAPRMDVLKVRITHFEGGVEKKPQFFITEDAVQKPAITIKEDHASISSGNLKATFLLNAPWQVDWAYKEKGLTQVQSKATGYMRDAALGPFLKEEFNLDVGEHIYGLGERFGTFVKNGQSIDIDNQDGGTASDQAYKNIPFFLSSKGYGLFVDTPDKVSFEVGSEKTSRIQFSVPGEELVYYMIGGENPKEILERYTALTGRPARLPSWSYGLWLSTSFTTSYDEKTILDFLDGMEKRQAHVSVFHFDCFWMRAYHWVDFIFDPVMFPDPKGLMDKIHARGTKVCLWINPYISQRSSMFLEGKEQGYLIKRPDGSVWQTDLWQPGMGIVDFTNAKAYRWYQDKLGALLDLGVDCFKTDFGERIPKDVVYADGSDPKKMHNYYTFLYNQAVFTLLEKRRGKGEACLFSRSATVGSQQFPLHWGGDCESTFVSMAETLRGGLSLGLCGFGFWSHDIGGFEGRPDPTLFKRWIEFGLLCSHSRLHGSKSYRVPWLVDEESSEITKKFLNLKHRMLKYLLRCGEEAATKGIPVLRAMLIEYPFDPACATLDRQYMLGPSLLVAPVFTPTGVTEYYLPKGSWTQVLDHRRVDSIGQWYKETYPVDSLPLWVKSDQEEALFN